MPWLHDVPLDEIEADPANERPAVDLLPEMLGDLMASMREIGLQERVKVYAVGPNRFRLSSGHRRHAAAVALGWETIPALVELAPVGADVDIARIAANLCRKDLDAVSLARGIAALLAGHPDLTQAKVGAMLGKSQSAVANTLRLLELPAEVLALIEAGKLTAGHALELCRMAAYPEVWNYKGPGDKRCADSQRELAESAIKDGASVKYLRHQVDSWLSNQKYWREEAERQRTAEAERALKDAHPELQTDAEQAETARRAAWAEKQARQEQCKVLTRATIRQALARPRGDGGTLKHFKAALGLLAQAAFAYTPSLPGLESRKAFFQDLERAADYQVVGALMVALVTAKLEYSVSFDGTLWDDVQWAAALWNLGPAIKAAHKAAGLLDEAPQDSPA